LILDHSKRPPASKLSRAVQYLRMSRGHQQYSITNQSAAIALYAAAYNIGVARSFVDAGKSGTMIRKRKGLQALLRVVQSGQADFDQILVYDVSRWGRFPDCDESAHYEYLCKRAGITVHYCAEQFENDNSTMSNLLKALRRTMAGEYSRELSVKVSNGQRRLASMGFWQGGRAPFGMARQLVSPNGERKRILKPGESKDVSTDRVVLTLGDDREIDIIRFAFDLYTRERKTRHQIADTLNQRSFLRGRPWTAQKLLALFTNPVYRGTYSYGKHHTQNGRTNHVPKENWLVRGCAFAAIISEGQWQEANARINEEVKCLTDSSMIEALRRLWKRKGKLNGEIVNAARDVPSVQAYLNHFGSINEAYKLIGYPLLRDYSYPHSRIIAAKMKSHLCDEICDQIRSIGGIAEQRKTLPGVVVLNKTVKVRVEFSIGLRRCRQNMEWRLPQHKLGGTDFLIVARLCPPSQSVLDYYVFPAFSSLHSRFCVHKDRNARFIDLYRCPNLQEFVRSFRYRAVWNGQPVTTGGGIVQPLARL
jgi:DNA invertase Pin-like site-specific DNA recombinase